MAIIAGCQRGSSTPKARTLKFRGNNADVYLRSVSNTLNDLGNNLDLEMLPAQPILTAATSGDGKEVRAVCIQNPRSPEEGIFDFLQVVDGNANFMAHGVQPGDIVRYYVKFDEEAAERNIEQRTAIELKVRRLDANDPQNSLILERGLNGPAIDPARVEIWRTTTKRTDAIRSMLAEYINDRQPPAAWEPSPDLAAVQQIIERANQWLRNLQDAEEKWKPEPLLKDAIAAVQMPDDGTPEEKKKAVQIGKAALTAATSNDALRNGDFTDGDGRQLEQAVWCRDIAQWARREAATDFDGALALFDWTVRNIQLDKPEQAVMIQHPWQALAYGHGTAVHRAWVFVELCRQQQIDAFLVRPKAVDGKPAPLLVGMMLPDSDAIYLFDPELGLPLPGREKAVGALAELIEHPELLRQFDVEGAPYPLTGEQLAEVEALLVASPLQLSQRGQRLESVLKGEESVRLSAEVRRQAELLKAQKHVTNVALWVQPIQAVVDEATLPYTKTKPYRKLAADEFEPFADRPLLWKARVMHFQGNKDIRAAERGDPLAQAREGHLDAMKYYQSPNVRPSDENLGKFESGEQTVFAAAKSAASYWLGLLCYDRGSYDVAETWLKGRSLDREPKGKWASGARYNLARTYEAEGKIDEAVKLLRGAPASDPQLRGNLVRAKRLDGHALQPHDQVEAGGAAAPSAAPSSESTGGGK